MIRVALATAFIALMLTGIVHASDSEKVGALRLTRHTQLSVETLVPVTEGSVWFSSCQPAPAPVVEQVLVALQGAQRMLKSRGWDAFSPLHVRAVIYDPPRIIYIDAGLTLKLINADRVEYFSVDKASRLATMIRRAFDNCN